MNATLFVRAILMVFLALAFPAASFAHWNVGVTVGFAPPELPVYAQTPCPSRGYIWTPGYWAYSSEDEDYYWVPGTWVLAPRAGLLWTPGYWAVDEDDYVWHEGYWAPHVGFYGGINYGFGYFGVGFVGGYWRDRDFYYNRAVTNITNVNVTNVYNTTVFNNRFNGNRASFNGGDGVHARPSPIELAAAREPHRGFTAPQRLQVQSARAVPGLLASVNHGHPSIAATTRPGALTARPVAPITRSVATTARAGSWNPSSARPMQHSVPAGPMASSNYRRPESQAPATTGARQESFAPAQAYRPAPSAPMYPPTPVYRPAPSAPAYRPAPSYTPPPRAQQAPPRPQPTVVHNQSYAAPRQPFAQAPRQQSNFRTAPPARASEPAPMQARRRL
jgi:hypothetical protein